MNTTETQSRHSVQRLVGPISPEHPEAKCDEWRGSRPQASTWTYGFWESPSAEEYARRQGVQPVTNIATLYGPGEPQDWEGFDEALERWHAETPVN